MKPLYQLVFILLSWLLLSPFIFHPTLGHNHTNNIQCINSERDALLHFKRGVTIDYCGLLVSWVTHTDCCQWHGVVCSNLTGHVIKLSLVGESSDVDTPCLKGEMSPFLGELSHLKHLNLSHNSFNGEIPHHLGNLSKLATLDLSYSYNDYGVNMKSILWISRLNLLIYLDLSSTGLTLVKDWMTVVNNLPSLRVLSMNNCKLSPNIPSSLTYVNSSATLHFIDLSSNDFNDSSIFQWLLQWPSITTQLVYLDLCGNQLHVSIPSEFGNLHSLSYLDLSYNQLHVPIPSEFGNLHSLSYLDLSYNQLHVPIPSEFGNLHSLSHLDLSANRFEGSVNKIISELCNLEQLYLEGNNFNDELAYVIQSFVNCGNKKLITLDLSHNSFRGAVPNSISSFSSLRELHLRENNLTGMLSEGIGQLSKLEILDVSSNSLEGTLTHAHFHKLVRLRKLYLSDNLRLLMNMVVDWIPPFQLDVIDLRSCELGPKFPKWVQMQMNFSYFDVSNTGISDNISVTFWNSLSSNLNYLNLSHNQFYGLLPNLPDRIQIDTLDLSSNLFEGAVPSGVTNTVQLFLNDNRFFDCSDICPKRGSDLFRLDLSNNLLSGELPDCWIYFHQLRSLHLENNRFSGNIPKSIGTLSTLEYLHLYNNSFSGSFRTVLENCTSLMILNLGYNLLTGYISPWIGNYSKSLGALILRKNNFIGEIPLSVCQLINLQILDLANNHISGVIPNCIANFTTMVGITYQGLYFQTGDMIDGKGIVFTEKVETAIVSWKGEEQRYKETVRYVKYIDLSSNELSGKIPNGISILNGLRSLDLSKNNLSGNIPLQIGNLTVLELLDLSNNHLTGEIPLSLAKVTTLDVMDVSNNNLSGEIPISTQLQSFNASAYAGNPRLCGAPLPSCSKDQAPSNELNGDKTSVQNKDDDFVFFLGLYISVVLGFIVGFWGVCGTLVIKTSWRYAYFRFLDRIKDRIM